MNIRSIIALAALLAAAPAFGCGGIEVEDARILEAPPGAGALAGYVTLHNPGGADVTLDGADAPGFAAVEFHSVAQSEAGLRMRAENELTIPAHGRLIFSPGKLHIMLFQPGKEYRSGDTVTLSLHCGSGRLAVVFPVKAR